MNSSIHWFFNICHNNIFGKSCTDQSNFSQPIERILCSSIGLGVRYEVMDQCQFGAPTLVPGRQPSGINVDSGLASVEPLFFVTRVSSSLEILTSRIYNGVQVIFCQLNVLVVAHPCSSISYLDMPCYNTCWIQPVWIIFLIWCSAMIFFLIIDLNVVPPFSNSDHTGITLNLFLADEILPPRSEVNMKHNLIKANWDGVISQILYINWQDLFSDLPYHKWWGAFHKQLTSIVSMNVPACLASIERNAFNAISNTQNTFGNCKFGSCRYGSACKNIEMNRLPRNIWIYHDSVEMRFTNML